VAKTSPKRSRELRARRWAAIYIREHIDTEQKFISDAQYEIKGQDLQSAIANGFLAGWLDRDGEGNPPLQLLEAAMAALDMIEHCGFGGSNSRAEKRIETKLKKAIRAATTPPGASTISPIAGPRTELVAESSDGPANSSAGREGESR